MKRWIPALILIFCTEAAMAQDLDDYKWKNRVLIMLADSPNDPILKAQNKELSAIKGDLKDRNLVILEETSPKGPYHEQFAVDTGFTAVLIGKDGGEKWRKTKTFRPSEVFKLIDSMPMRQQEME